MEQIINSLRQFLSFNNKQNDTKLQKVDFDIDYESLPAAFSSGAHATAGALAGMTEHVVMYPLDSVKTRMQSLCPNPQARYRSVTEAMVKMIQYEGVLRPVKGVSAVIASAGPAHALHYACYEQLKAQLSGTIESYNQSHMVHGAAGSVSTILHDTVMNPAEVVKQRMQVYGSPYRSSIECMIEVYRREGFRAFYRSYLTTLSMNIPFQAVHFITYECMQNFLNRSRDYSPRAHVVCGGVAGGLAAAVTTPLDVCKTLINTQERQLLTECRQRSITGFIHAATMVYTCCGLRGYFNGLQARVLHSMPAAALSWSVYEFFKYVSLNRQQQRQLSSDYDHRDYLSSSNKITTLSLGSSSIFSFNNNNSQPSPSLPSSSSSSSPSSSGLLAHIASPSFKVVTANVVTAKEL